MAPAARSVSTRSGTATPITTRRAAGGAHGARAWSTSLRNLRGQLVLLDDQPARTTMLAGPRPRHRHRDDAPKSDRGGGRGARHGGGADEAQPATATSSPSMAPHPVRGRHPGWRLTAAAQAHWVRMSSSQTSPWVVLPEP